MATSVTVSHLFGTVDVTAAGTAVQLDGTDYRVQSVLLIAHDDNVGRIFYGGSDVASTTQKGLNPGDSVRVTGGGSFLLSTIYVDAASNNDGVDFVVVRAV